MALRIFHNYKHKLVAFFVAIFVWFIVVTENTYEYEVDIPVSVVNLPSDKVVLNNLPASAKVRIRGNGKDLIALTLSRGVRLELDLSHVSTRHTFFLNPNYVEVSRPLGNLDMLEVLSPDSVSVRLDDVMLKRIPVVPRVRVQPAAGFTAVGNLTIQPDSIDIVGPKTLVDQIEETYTVEAEYTDLTFDLEQTFDLVSLPFEKVNSSVQEVGVYINIQKLSEMTFKGVPIQIRNAPRGLRIQPVPSTLSLVLMGGGEVLLHLDRDDIVAYIDYNRVRYLPGNEFPAVIDKPEGISYRDVNPRTFKLIIEKSGSD